MDCCKRLKHDADATISSLIAHIHSNKQKQPQQLETKSTAATLPNVERQNTDALLDLQKRFDTEQTRFQNIR